MSIWSPPLLFFENCFLDKVSSPGFLWLLILYYKTYFYWKLHWNFKLLGRYESFLSILTIFINYLGFFYISLLQIIWWRQLITDDISIFYLQPTLNWLFNNYIKIYWYCISFSWNMKGVQVDHPKTKLPSKNPALLGLNFSTSKCLWRIQELCYIYFNERLFCNQWLKVDIQKQI